MSRLDAPTFGTLATDTSCESHDWGTSCDVHVVGWTAHPARRPVDGVDLPWLSSPVLAGPTPNNRRPRLPDRDRLTRAAPKRRTSRSLLLDRDPEGLTGTARPVSSLTPHSRDSRVSHQPHRVTVTTRRP